MEKEKQLKCVVCGLPMACVYSYHKHNIRQHSHVQLSRAILKLQQLQLPLNDPSSDEDDEDEDEEERRRLELDMADVLALPIKCELMDEEVIELGPTENADDLQVQSRLVKNPNDAKQQSRQIIEVQENNLPPCFINPSIEDPDAIVVKFNRELVMVLDNAKAAIGTTFPNKKKCPNRLLRAVSKSSIDIPDATTYAKDFKPFGSRSHDKYVMQNIILMENPPKRQRGRPRRVLKPQSVSKVGELRDLDGLKDASEEEDLAELVDPLLLSDNEDDKVTAALPNITRSRSGRIIKMKKGDDDFKYYDISGQDTADPEDLNNQSEWKEDVSQDKVKGRQKRKRKFDEMAKPTELNPTGIQYQQLTETTKKNTEHQEPTKAVNYKDDDKHNTENVEVSAVEEGMSMPLITHHIEEEPCIQVGSSKCVGHCASTEGCILCFKSFGNSHEHLTNEKPSDLLNVSPLDIPENLLNHDETEVKMTNENEGFSSLKGIGEEHGCQEKLDDCGTISEEQESPSKQENSESLLCGVCNVSFPSKEELKMHSHESLYECHFCQKKYQSRMTLQAHLKKYHEDTEWMKYKCATCGKSFGFLLALERHMKEHNPNQKFCCDQCGKVFKNLGNLKNHIPLHTKDEIYECPHCPKLYYIKNSFDKHLKSHESNPQYQCNVCDRKFTEKKHFEYHLERHQNSGSHGRSKDYKCNNCGDIKTQTEIEIIAVTDIGHHKTCIACGKGFYKKYRFIVDNPDSSLTLPVRDERPREQCKWCGKYVLNLPRHIKGTHLGNEYVACDLCGLVVTKASLPSHKNRKHGGSQVTCDHCNQTFKNVMCLREHMTKVRRKEDPSRNVCKFCKEVVNAENWKEHMAKHKSKCNDCGAAHFSTHEEFLNHLDSCRRCSNCNLSTFESREEYLNHIEICSSGIDIITSSFDPASEQEVVTSIFAIVDGNSCDVCGLIATDPESLAQHIASDHPEAIPAEQVFGDSSSMISEDILYACPKEACGAIVTSKNQLKNHMSAVHNSIDGDEDSRDVSHTQELEIGGRKYLYNPTF